MNLRSGLLSAGAIVLGSILMVTLGWGLQHAAMSSPQLLGRTAPRLAIQQPGGPEVKVWELRGEPVVLNFWASWCGPCAQELPVLAAAHQEHPNVAFVGADIQDTSGGAASFERLHPHMYPVGPIVTGTYQDYGVVGPPVTVFINAQGIVTASFAGPLDRTTIEHYLGLISS